MKENVSEQESESVWRDVSKIISFKGVLASGDM